MSFPTSINLSQTGILEPDAGRVFSPTVGAVAGEPATGAQRFPPPEAHDITQEGDQTDHASAASEREFALQNRERIQRLLRQTERALSKLEDGTYGYCEDTGEPIDLKRLMAQPATSLSLAAQQAREGRAG